MTKSTYARSPRSMHRVRRMKALKSDSTRSAGAKTRATGRRAAIALKRAGAPEGLPNGPAVW